MICKIQNNRLTLGNLATPPRTSSRSLLLLLYLYGFLVFGLGKFYFDLFSIKVTMNFASTFLYENSQLKEKDKNFLERNK